LAAEHVSHRDRLEGPLQDASACSGKAFWNAQCHLLAPDPGDIWVTNDLQCRVNRLLRACDLRFWVELRGFEPLAPSMRMWSCINQLCYRKRRNLAAADPR